MLKLAIYVSVPLLAGVIGFIIAISRKWRHPFVMRLPWVSLYSVAVTFFSPSIIVYLVLCSLTVPLFARGREEIVPIFIFSMLLSPVIGLTTHIGSMMLLPITGFTTLAVGAALWTLNYGRHSPTRSYLSALCISSFLLVLLIAGARETSFTNVLRVTLDLTLSVIIPFFVVRRCITSGYDVRLVVIGLIAATAGLSAIAIFEANTSWPLFREVYGHYGIELGQGAAVKLRGGFLRSPGPFVEPTTFALWLALGTGSLLASSWLFRFKLNYYAMVVFLLFGLFAPQSRGAWLGLIVFYAALQMVSGRSASLLKPALFTFFAGLLIYGTGLAVPRVGNMLGLSNTGSVSRDYRQDLFSRGLEESRNHLLFGTSLDRVKFELRDLVQGEGQVDFVNSYLYVLLVSGLLGLVLYAFTLVAPLVALFKLREGALLEDQVAISIVFAAICSLTMMFVFTGVGGRNITVIVVLVGLAGSLLNAGQAGKRRIGEH